jgi:hypothetical protein
MACAVTVRVDDYAVAKICHLDWQGRSEEEMVAVAWAYYYFSVQFRENLEICSDYYPDDQALLRLKAEECNTSNLSPFPGVAMEGEKMNHDEFMRRLLGLFVVELAERERFERIGQDYLAKIRNIPRNSRALSIASYEDGGLERVFSAMLQAPAYSNPLLKAFRFFLSAHVEFDSDQIQGHGSLSRHLVPDDNIVPLWDAFAALLLNAVPALAPMVSEHEP